jgi:putative transposase
MKYEFILRYRSQFRIGKMYRVLRVTQSGCYYWIDRPESKSTRENRNLLKEIKEVYQTSNKVYGSPRITEELFDRGFNASRNRVARLIASNDIKSKTKCKFKVTTNSITSFLYLPICRVRAFMYRHPDVSWFLISPTFEQEKAGCI